MSKSAQLKNLQTQRKELRGELGSVNKIISEGMKKKTEIKARMEILDNQITGMQDKEVVITEHAMLRYIERVMGLNMDDVRMEILPEVTEKQVQALRQGTFPVNDGGKGFKILVKNNTVVTILTKEGEKE